MSVSRAGYVDLLKVRGGGWALGVREGRGGEISPQGEEETQ